MTQDATDGRSHGGRVLELADHDPQLQQLMPDPGVEAAIRQPGSSYAQIVATALDGYAGRPALGERAYEVELDFGTGRRERRFLPRFETIPYLELHNRIKSVANTWSHDEQHGVRPGDFVCILGFSGTDYATVDLACVYAQAVSVPLQTSLATADLDGIFTDTAPTAVAAAVDDLVQAAEYAGAHASIRSVIALDYDEHVDHDREQYAAAATELAQARSSARLVTIDELISLGDFAPWTPLEPSSEGDERMALIIHSSGSTGTPKGAIITERIARAQWEPAGAPVPVVRLAFAPMNHMGGRSMVYSTLARGGTVNFTASTDLSTLFEDIRLTRPTDLMFFPRVVEMIHRHYLSELMRRSDAGAADPEAIQAAVMEEIRGSFLGDRISAIGVATAPTTPELQQFMRDCFQLPLNEGYGSTETGTITVRDRILRPPVLDYRLRDVPELGYSTADTPYPRGELCVKTTRSTPGYFKRPEATARLFDEDGYLLTGDVVEERGPDHVVLIDRRNDVLKLSQGEFVALGAVGATIESGSDLIHQIYLYGNSSRSYILAVVVPDLDVVERMLGPAVDEPTIKDLVRSELRDVASAANLKSFEVPRDLLIEREPFSHENGLLSSVHKRLRPALNAKYGERLEEMYAESERKQHEELMALRGLGGELTVLEKVGKALEASLGVPDIDVSQPYSFVDLGGDSLGATAFASLLEDTFGVALPVNAILSPAGNPQQWARAIEAARSEAGHRVPTFDTIHGRGALELNAADLDVTRFIDADTLARVPAGAPPDLSRRVLMTGATGFLGRFMCLEWLDRLSTSGGTLTCLVRASDRDAAWQRLVAVFEATDPALEQRFHRVAGEHLEVVVGDAAEPLLGLGTDEFDRLSAEIDRIVHVGALVNHVLPYPDLFAPNVAGTAELARLALTQRRKRFDFVSSAATTYMIDRRAGNDEDTPLRPKIALTGFGYGTSKWASEQLLHSVHRKFGLPINVFHGDMMLAHRQYRRQINEADVFTRLLSSVILTGLAPESFYPLEPDGGRARAHYDGLPVDFVAGSIVGITVEPHDELRTYHALNHHDDGLSLDTFVDWIGEAGYGVERVPDYTEWFHRFEAALRALPDDQRQHTSLSVLQSLSHPRANEAMIGSKRFQDAVRLLPVGPDVPQLERAFILKCLDDLRGLGFIPEPTG